MQHDHVLEKLNFDQFTPSLGSGVGLDLGVGGSADKIFGTCTVLLQS